MSPQEICGELDFRTRAKNNDVPIARLIGFEAIDANDGRAVAGLTAGRRHANLMGAGSFAILPTPPWVWRLRAHSHQMNPSPRSNSKSTLSVLSGKHESKRKVTSCSGVARLDPWSATLPTRKPDWSRRHAPLARCFEARRPLDAEDTACGSRPTRYERPWSPTSGRPLTSQRP
jgi:hypothetical protein